MAGIGSALVYGLVSAVISAAVSWIFAPDAPDSEGPRLGDLAMQTSSFGKFMGRVHGFARKAGNVIWIDGIKEHVHEEDIDAKGGDDGTKTTYTYTCSFAVGICEGPIAGIKRIWADSKLLYDSVNQDETTFNAYLTQRASLSQANAITIYKGNDLQMPDPTMEAILGEGNVPGYRNLVYVVFDDLELENYGNRIPNLEFEIAQNFAQPNVTLPFYNCTYDLQYRLGVFYRAERYAVKQYDRLGNLTEEYPEFCKSVAISGLNRVLANVANDLKHIRFQYQTEKMYMLNSDVDFVDFYYSDFDIDDGHLWILNQSTGEVFMLWYHWGFTYEAPPYLDIPTYRAIRHVWMNLKLQHYDADGVNGLSGYGSICARDGKILVEYRDDAVPVHQIEVYNQDGSYVETLTLTGDISGMTSPHANYGLLVNEFGDMMVMPEAVSIAVFNDIIYVMDGISATQKVVPMFSDEEADFRALDVIVADIFESVGLDSTEYDVTALADDKVIGFLQQNMMTGKKLLEPLMQVYEFDIIETDWKLICKKRGSDPVVNIPYNQLGAREYGSEYQEPLNETRISELELPRELALQYMDYQIDYQANLERATRSVNAVTTKDKQTLNLPIVMRSTQALQAVEKIFQTLWKQRVSYNFAVSCDYIKIQAGDVITIADNYKLLPKKVSLQFPNLIQIDAVLDDSRTYISANAGQVSDSIGQSIFLHPFVFALYLNLPGLADATTHPGFYMALYTSEAGFSSAALYQSVDQEATWDFRDRLFSTAIVGFATTILADAGTTRFDGGSSVNIDLLSYGRSLSSATKESVLEGTNTAAIGAEGRWEIVSFMDVVEETDGTYTLTNFIRGRKGTDYNTGNHAIGDGFVLLTESTIKYIQIGENKIDSEINYRLVYPGTTLQSQPVTDFTCEGDNLKPYSPVHIKGVRGGSTDVEISWVRRSRNNASWGYSDVPVAETEEKYEIDIYDGDDVVRAITVTDDTIVTYTAAQQTTDFGSVQASINIKIYQISEVIGRGTAGTATI